jgi:signal transduction histidine kinase
MKAFYAASVADMHTHSLMDIQRDEERRERDRNLRDLEKEKYANESRRKFFKYLFHEVRTPLNSLSMGVDLLKTLPVLSPADLELLDMMGGAADFMSETLNNILSMQKIEEGKMELTFVPFSISSSINKIVSAMAGAAISKSVTMDQHIAAEVPALLVGDVYRVEHVISNLLSNAIKFSPTNGAIRVTVTVSAAAAPDTHIHTPSPSPSATSIDITVSISDEGPGISAENQEKLFGGFFQVRPDQLQQGKGSGLGLALCKEIVTLHGGTIGVDSVEGQGSTFHFRIPFRIPSDESEVGKIARGEEVDLNLLDMGGSDEVQPLSPRILVVDGKGSGMNQPALHDALLTCLSLFFSLLYLSFSLCGARCGIEPQDSAGAPDQHWREGGGHGGERTGGSPGGPRAPSEIRPHIDGQYHAHHGTPYLHV